MPDHSLVERLRGGDQTALRELITQHWQALVAVAMVTTRSEDLAIEAVQDAFIRLWEIRTTLDPARSAKGLLWTLTRYRALNVMRGERVHTRLAQRLAQTIGGQAPVSYNTGAQAIELAEFDAYVVGVIQGLPPRCREVFLMNRKLHMSYAEIAETLGMSVLTARNQMSLALQRIARAMIDWRKSI